MFGGGHKYIYKYHSYIMYTNHMKNKNHYRKTLKMKNNTSIFNFQVQYTPPVMHLVLQTIDIVNKIAHLHVSTCINKNRCPNPALR